MRETSSDIGALYDERVDLFRLLANRLEEKAAEALEGQRHIDRISFRVKEKTSFLKKCSNPKYEDPFNQLEDIVAGRVLTFFRDDIERVRERLCEWFGEVEHDTKEPAGPKEFDYESEHFVFVIADHYKPPGWSKYDDMPATFEMQVRTLFMHAWAEPQHDLGYKGADLDRETTRELAWIAASAWGADRTLNGIAQRLITER